MSVQKLIFCDMCNPQCMKPIEMRRAPRDGERTGRRISDGRAWIEGELRTALANGWICTNDGRHICPACQKNTQSDYQDKG